MKKIITISREFGAGGGTIGQMVADRLGYAYYDKAIILQAARESNVDVMSFQKWDERIPKDFGFTQSLFEFYNKPLNERLFQEQKKIIRRIGEKGSCVIVGRNANSILREFDRTLHVFIHASTYARLARMKEKMPDATENEILEKMHSVDRMRRKYCAYYTDTRFGEAEYYDLCLSSSTLGVEACVDLICQAAGQAR